MVHLINLPYFCGSNQRCTNLVTRRPGKSELDPRIESSGFKALLYIVIDLRLVAVRAGADRTPSGPWEDIMSRIARALNRNAERWALSVFYVMLVATRFIEVLRRELMSYSSIWGEEIVRYAFIYIAWIGAAAAMRERGRIRIDVIMQYAGRRANALLYIFGDLVMIAVALIALYWSCKSVLVSAKFGSVTHGLRVSQVWFLSAIPIGFALVVFRLIQSFLRDLGDLRHGRPVYEGDRPFD